MKTAIDNNTNNAYGCVLIKLYLQKQTTDPLVNKQIMIFLYSRMLFRKKINNRYTLKIYMNL